MRSICFFASYFESNQFPYYVRVYLLDLKKQVTELVLLSTQMNLNAESLEFLNEHKITLQIEANEGFDFGLWYKAFQKTDLENYDRVLLVNDSCILFKPLNEVMSWSKQTKADFMGITQSEAIAPHLQSYFLILNKTCLPFVNEYFKQKGLLKSIEEVITTYEVGLSTYLLSKGLYMAAYSDNNGYTGEFSPYYQCADYHLMKGIPLIKKKIIFSTYRKDELFTLARMNFNIDKNHYISLIKKTNPSLILDFDRLAAETPDGLSHVQKWKYAVISVFINVFRPLYKKLK